MSICMDNDDSGSEKQTSQETQQSEVVTPESQAETGGLASVLTEQPNPQDEQGFHGASGDAPPHQPVKSKSKLKRTRRYRYKPYQTKPHGPKKSDPDPSLSPKKLPLKPRSKKPIPNQTYELTSYGYWPTQASTSTPQPGPSSEPDTTQDSSSKLPQQPIMQPPSQPAQPHVPRAVLGYGRYRLNVPLPKPWPHPMPGQYRYHLRFSGYPRFPRPQLQTPTQAAPQPQPQPQKEVLEPEVIQLEVESDEEEEPIDLTKTTTQQQDKETKADSSTEPKPPDQPPSKPEPPPKPTPTDPKKPKKVKLINLEIHSKINPGTFHSEVRSEGKTYLMFLADEGYGFINILEQGNLIAGFNDRIYVQEAIVVIANGLVMKVEVLLNNGNTQIIVRKT
uniref:Uncharacterized protein n=2 Tax=Theileria parva TaxID=5875 RepID=Q4N3U6_THEPA|eukprot:XP_765460.1 hypothetical protein [Theileria parva strain Muguga]